MGNQPSWTPWNVEIRRPQTLHFPQIAGTFSAGFLPQRRHRRQRCRCVYWEEKTWNASPLLRKGRAGTIQLYLRYKYMPLLEEDQVSHVK